MQSLTTRHANIEDFRSCGVRSVHYLPFAYDPDVHRPWPENIPTGAPRDVLFVGGVPLLMDAEDVRAWADALRLCAEDRQLLARLRQGVKPPRSITDVAGEMAQLYHSISTAIDIGGAYGEYTLFFLRNTTASQVYAFEPDATMLSHLKNNLELNPEANTERLILPKKFLGGPNLKSAVCLGTLADRISLPCFIKMDVDGAEAEILSGATHSVELERALRNSIRTFGVQDENRQECLVALYRPGTASDRA